MYDFCGMCCRQTISHMLMKSCPICKRLPQQTVPQSFCYCSNTSPRQWIGTWEDAGKICSPDLWDVAKPTCTTSICYSWCTFHLLLCNLEHSKPIIIWKKTITSRAWCKAVKLNSAPHQFTSASAEGLESLNFPSSNKTMNLIHVHIHWQYWYIYIRFSFTKLSSLHILGILRPSFQANAPQALPLLKEESWQCLGRPAPLL